MTATRWKLVTLLTVTVLSTTFCLSVASCGVESPSEKALAYALAGRVMSDSMATLVAKPGNALVAFA